MNKRYGTVNNWLLDIPSGSILHLSTGERKRLGEYQLKLLNVLMQEAGKTLTREELTALVWEGRVIGNNSLPNAIHALRTALEDDGKQQKIIKTIPKKGYLLEPEYCGVVDVEENDVTVNIKDTESESLIEDIPPAEQSDNHIAVNQDIEPPLPHPVSSVTQTVSVFSRQWVIVALLFILLIALCSAAITGVIAKRQRGDILYGQETQASVYSNIRLFAIDHAGNPTWEQDNLYSKLKDSLYILNQRLKSQSIKMNVYYLSENQTLNYTFSLNSACDNKQLVMTIYHWRIDPLRLNNLIMRETGRKLDEMATCKPGE